jgi:hypothetical protein
VIFFSSELRIKVLEEGTVMLVYSVVEVVIAVAAAAAVMVVVLIIV